MKHQSHNEEKQPVSPDLPLETPENGPDSAAKVQESSVAGEKAAETKASESSGGTAAQAASELDQMKARIAELEKTAGDLNDQYLRKAADFDNYRKRMIREKQEAVDYANSNLLVDLVQVMDDFDRAITAGGEHDEGSPAAAFANGISMIRNQMASMLENKYFLKHYPVKGEPFDPTIHEAVGSIPSTEVKEPVVAEEFVKGYKLKDRVVRLAKVMVNMPAEDQKDDPRASK